MVKVNQSVSIILILLLAIVAAFYLTGGNILFSLFGFLVIVLFIMADVFIRSKNAVNAGSKQASIMKKRNLVVVGIFGTITSVGLIVIIISCVSGTIYFS